MKIKRLTATAKLPTYATPGSAGMDLYSDEDVTILPTFTQLVHTGLAMAIPKGYVGLVFPRSGLSLKTSLRQPNSVGVIDCDYRGEVRGMFQNTNPYLPIRIAKGDRFAQMVVVPYVRCMIEDAAELDGTERGTGGFGSTGINDKEAK